MKLTLLGEDAIRLEPVPGPLTIEASSGEQHYSPFHMLAGGLAYCTFSVLYAWAANAGLPADDLILEVRWSFGEDPHRVDRLDVGFAWPSLPERRHDAARRVAEMCTVHATLQHPPRVDVHPLPEARPAPSAPGTMPVVRFTVRGEPGIGEDCEYTVVYDGDCRVCTRIARALRAWDRAHLLQVVPSRTPGVAARFPWIPPRAFAEALQLIRRDGTTWSGAAAVEQLLQVLPRGRLISWIFRVPLMRGLAGRFYRWFARNRYRLGCGAHCRTRPPDVRFREAGPV